MERVSVEVPAELVGAIRETVLLDGLLRELEA